jgi:hypothetical protein
MKNSPRVKKKVELWDTPTALQSEKHISSPSALQFIESCPPSEVS